MVLFFYSGFLALGVILITLVLINEQRKNKPAVSKHFIRDKLSEFLKITPMMQKIETIEKELHPAENSPSEKLSALIENDWKMKYEKLETLFQEKSADFGKIEQALNNEIKNRAGFEDFKYLLEEEIERSKEKRRQLQAELNNLEMENENLRSKLA